jgi:hypothetical protein
MRRLIVAVLLAVAVSGAVKVYADDGDFVLRKPKECEGLSWTDADYWYYACYTF